MSTSIELYKCKYCLKKLHVDIEGICRYCNAKILNCQHESVVTEGDFYGGKYICKDCNKVLGGYILKIFEEDLK